MNQEDSTTLRKLIIETVLATDMMCVIFSCNFSPKISFNYEWVNKFNLKKEHLDKDKADDRLLLMCMALKCADISNVCKPGPVYRSWTDRLLQEVSE